MNQQPDIKHRIHEKLNTLVLLYQEALQHNRSLEQKVLSLQEQLNFCQNQLSLLENEAKNRTFAQHIGQGEEKSQIQHQIDNLIAEIDLCLKHLQEE
ncbi:MAG: hypothetical protein LC115_09725 [Bacteroidia bacterium]|nr:hypothetical protein [Bacteroidia bacterium]